MKINHIVEGNGPCVVLLHGLMENLHIWDALAEQLSGYYKVVRLDLPGHGETPVVSPIHTMEFMAQCVNAVLESYQIDECVMVGHSMGGYVMTAFAKMYPEKLRGICYFHSNAAEDSEGVKAQREKVSALIMNDKLNYITSFIPDLFTPENRETYKADIDARVEAAKQMKPEGIAAAQLGMKERLGGLDMLSDINVPVLFIVGKQDPRVVLPTILAQAMLPKHAEILLLDNVAHMGFIEARQKTADMVESFADRCFSY